MTSTNWLATPARLILLRFSHQCPLPLPHNVKERIRAPEKIVENYRTTKRPRARLLFDVFCSCLYLANGFCFCLLAQLFGVVARRYDPIIYLQTQHKHAHSHTHTHTYVQPLSAKMYNLRDHSLIFLFSFFRFL